MMAHGAGDLTVLRPATLCVLGGAMQDKEE